MAKKTDDSVESGKATITGVYFRIDKGVSDMFLTKVPLSEHKREEIVEKLLKEYNEKGDNIFNILTQTPF
jgi:inorganic pyrophosphatase/exopolyphosphatase